VLDTRQGKVVSDESLFSGQFGRLREVSVDKDGYLYLLTSNRDGRGTPAPNDDRILKIMPIKGTGNLAPLKQLKHGVDPHDIKCNDNYVLVLKQKNNSPACVSPPTAAKLAQRGWATS
jgi:hypothetical protein